MVERAKPRDDAASNISDSDPTEVEIAADKYLGRNDGSAEQRDAQTRSGAAKPNNTPSRNWLRTSNGDVRQ